MNAVEIEEAVSELATLPFDAQEFPFAFLAAFGNKEVTIKRLRSGSSKSSDVPGGVLQRNNIHLATCAPGEVGATLKALRESPKTTSAKAKFLLATDGVEFEAEDLGSGETVACSFGEFAQHFGFFLPLAGISTVRQIANNPIDIKATGRLNKLYIELLKENPDWGTEARRHDLNEFMSRLIFCFFAGSTGIFLPKLFTKTVEQMSDSQSGNTHEVIAECFRAMDTKIEDRKAANFRPWADAFPYVNGGLFAGTRDCPRFSRAARAYLLRAGELDWQTINPDIFGSMIQAVADEGERGSLGMHYTSVPNILKVLNPLFLDDLREQLAAAGDSVRKLRALRRRIASIRVFDPACGSGNFLVIAYIKMREIEYEIAQKLGDNPKSWIKLENFYGIEIKDFAVEIARLSLLIAEFQCDARLISQSEAKLNVLPLHRTGQFHRDNALRMDWLRVCPPVTKTVTQGWDLGGPTGRLALEDNGLGDANEVETYICGNPPYKGSQDQTDKQKKDLELAFANTINSTKSADYVSGWFIKAASYIRESGASFSFVTTNSINQGRQVSLYWPTLLGDDLEIFFAVPSFRWQNLASKNAVVTVSIVGMRQISAGKKKIYTDETYQMVDYIGAYLVPNHSTIVAPSTKPLFVGRAMRNGSMPNDNGGLLLTPTEFSEAVSAEPEVRRFCKKFIGSDDAISGDHRYCLWLTESDFSEAKKLSFVRNRVAIVKKHRAESTRETTNNLAATPYAFGEIRHIASRSLLIPRHSAEDRPYLPSAPVTDSVVVADSALFLPNFELMDFSLHSSRLHLVWIATVCGKLETRYRYSNTLGWNTFPVPTLTKKNKADLTRCAEDILLAREAHFPATIADLYDPENMPEDLRRAHEKNDETLERIYIGRRFKNDTERLEKLFDLYTKMTDAKNAKAVKAKAPKKAKAAS